MLKSKQTHPLSPRMMTFNKVFLRDDEAMVLELASYQQTGTGMCYCVTPTNKCHN